MSNWTNQQLFDRVAVAIEYFEGKQPADLLQTDLDNDDMDSLYSHLLQAEAEMSIQETHNEFLAEDIY